MCNILEDSHFYQYLRELQTFNIQQLKSFWMMHFHAYCYYLFNSK